MGLKESLLSAVELRRTAVVISGQNLFVREMTAAERDAYEVYQFEAQKKGEALNNFRVRLVCKTLVDDAGNRVFTDDEVELVGRLRASEISKAFDEATKLNGLSKEDQDDIRKN